MAFTRVEVLQGVNTLISFAQDDFTCPDMYLNVKLSALYE